MHLVNNHIAFTPFNKTRIMAVLQRIALCYLFAALMAHYFSVRNLIITSVVLLFLYWWLLYAFGDAGMQYTITGNAVRKIDLLVLGEQHMYQEDGIVFDPEGLLSTIPAIVNVTAGYVAGRLIIKKGKTKQTVIQACHSGYSINCNWIMLE